MTETRFKIERREFVPTDIGEGDTMTLLQACDVLGMRKQNVLSAMLNGTLPRVMDTEAVAGRGRYRTTRAGVRAWQKRRAKKS